MQFALAGLGGLALSAYVVSRTGNASDFFLPGLLANAAYASAYLISILVRWPLLGIIVAALQGKGMEWRRDPEAVRRYSRASWIWVGLFTLRLAVQLPLYFARRPHRARRGADRHGRAAVRGRDLAVVAGPPPPRDRGRGRVIRRLLACAALAAALAPAAARADWNGDGNGDVVAVASDGRLLLYAGNGAGGFAGPGTGIGTGWGSFSRLLWPGDFSGDGRADLLAVHPDGRLLLYRGNGSGGFTAPYPQIGSGWAGFTAVLPAGDFSGDGKPDLLARRADGVLVLYRGNGAGGFATGRAEPVGSGWQSFTAVLPGGDFSGDGRPDVLARRGDGTLVMYRGDGAGGWLTGAAERIGTGWAPFTALASGGDFSGDGRADVLARQSDGTLLLYRGNGTGGFVPGTGERIGAGWNALSLLTLVTQAPVGAGAGARPAGGADPRRAREAGRRGALHAARAAGCG